MDTRKSTRFHGFPNFLSLIYSIKSRIFDMVGLSFPYSAQ